MAKKIYSFNYNTEFYILSINTQRVEITFKNELDSYVYINKINLTNNIILGTSGILERLENGEYQTADGLKLNLDPDNYYFKISFNDDDSYIENVGDGSMLLYNNGYLSFYDDDRDLKISPRIITRPWYELYIKDGYKISHLFKVILGDNFNFNLNYLMAVITPYMDTTIGEYIGVNNIYEILSEQPDNIPYNLLSPDIQRNNLDTIFN